MSEQRSVTTPWRFSLSGRSFARHEVRYLAVAGTTTLVYLVLVAAGLFLGLQYLLAIAAAHVVTICGAFPAYRRLVFRSTRAWPADLWRFLSVWSGGMAAGFVLTPFLVELVGMEPFVAQLLAIAVVAGSSYVAHRFWSFGERGRGEGLGAVAAHPAPRETA